MKKVVLDTSSIIKDPICFKKFGTAEVFIPLVVIEELDAIKERHNEAAVSARRFIKELDAMAHGQLIQYPGIQVGEGRLSVVLCNDDIADDLYGDTLDFGKADNQILASCLMVKNLYCEDGSNVVLISEDRNLRLKARFVGVDSEGCYTADCDCQCKGVLCLDEVPLGIIEELFSSSSGIEPAIIKISPMVNDYMVLRNGSVSALAACRRDGTIRRVKKRDAAGITPKNAEQSFAMDALLNPDIKLVSLIGKAGTGKTLLALAAALEQKSQYRQIMLARPVVPLGNDVGYLPGDINEKLKPYMQPLFDNIKVIQEQSGDRSSMGDKIGKMIEDEKIVIEPLTYIRGRSLLKAFLIVDEAQNLTGHEVKTILTRAGEGTKIVLTGDIEQIDHSGLDSETNGLAYLAERMRGQHLYANVVLEKGERSELATMASELL